MQTDELPYLDEHATLVAADVDAVWAALLDTLDRTFTRPRAVAYARAVGCADASASGLRPLTEGSTLPGFRVLAAAPGEQLVLAGRHRFASYAIVVRLEQAGPRSTTLRVESRAVFPGPLGAAYRLLVVGTRGHVVAVRRLLGAVKRSAERSGR